MFGMKPREPTNHQVDTAQYEYVSLADGTTVAVARGNLAAAKSLLAAQKAAGRRVAAAQWQRDAVAASAPQPAQRHPQPARRERAIYRVAAKAHEQHSLQSGSNDSAIQYPHR